MTDGPLLEPAPLPPGTAAPAFRLPAGPDRTIALDDLRGRPAILAFYPADWSPVCGDQMALYQEVMPMFEAYGARAGRHLRRRGLVPPGLRRRSEHPLPSAGGLRAQGRRVVPVQRLPHRRGRKRAGPVRARTPGRGPLERAVAAPA